MAIMTNMVALVDTNHRHTYKQTNK